jgi:hypothetical protein
VIDVDELQRLADSKAVVLLTFTGGERMIADGVLPGSREVLVIFNEVTDRQGVAVRTSLADGSPCTFWIDGAGGYHPVIESIRGYATEAKVA